MIMIANKQINDPDGIVDLIQDIMNLLFENATPEKPVQSKTILKYTIQVIQNKLHGYFPKKYVSQAVHLMNEKHRLQQKGYFKWGMVELYYIIKREKETHSQQQIISKNAKDLLDELFELFEYEFESLIDDF